MSVLNRTSALNGASGLNLAPPALEVPRAIGKVKKGSSEHLDDARGRDAVNLAKQGELDGLRRAERNWS